MGKMRTIWKKAKTDIGKKANFKHDLGPNLDEFEKTCIEYTKAVETASEAVKKLSSQFDTIRPIMDYYAKQMNDLAKDAKNDKALAKGIQGWMQVNQNLNRAALTAAQNGKKCANELATGAKILKKKV